MYLHLRVLSVGQLPQVSCRGLSLACACAVRRFVVSPFRGEGGRDRGRSAPCAAPELGVLSSLGSLGVERGSWRGQAREARRTGPAVASLGGLVS